MYDRKKITLFILLIATVILGGVSLYLATQINQSQAPDDSLAGTGVCSSRYSNIGQSCSGFDTENACEDAIVPFSTGNCCEVTGNVCTQFSEAGACAGISCQFLSESACTTTNVNRSYCRWTESSQATSICSAPGGQTINEGSSLCNAGTNYQRYSCINGTSNGSNAALALNEYCRPAGGQCSQGGTTECSSGFCCSCGKCSGNSSGNDCTAQCGTTTGGTTTGGTTTTGGDTTGGSTTGSSCVSTAPIKAKLTSPGNGAVVNTNTATLAWDRNGSFGEGCESQNNEFRVRVTTVGLTEACPTNTSNSGSYTKVGTVDAAPAGTFNLSVETGKKYCWLIRKHNGAEATDSGIRSFTVDIAAVAPTTGVDEEETGGTTTGDIDPTTGEVLSASGSGSLPATAILSDELDPLILGMILVIIGLTLYKFDFGRKREEA